MAELIQGFIHRASIVAQSRFLLKKLDELDLRKNLLEGAEVPISYLISLLAYFLDCLS